MRDDVIRLDHVNKEFSGRQILKDVTLAVKQGDILGYLGPSGAGKTTTIGIILGLLQATSGQVSVLGQDGQMSRTRQKMGFVLEADGLYDKMTAYDNLVYYAKLYDLSQPAQRVDEMLKLVGLADRARDKAGTYSKGMRQRLALARAMAPDPELLVLDEPTAGVDPTGQIEGHFILLPLSTHPRVLPVLPGSSSPGHRPHTSRRSELPSADYPLPLACRPFVVTVQHKGGNPSPGRTACHFFCLPR